MRFLVTMESVTASVGLSPAENAEMMEDVVLPSLKTLAEWESAGKIRGGLMAGRRGTAFVIDAASAEELSDLLGSLPVWGTAEVDVVPIESYEYRVKALQGMIQQLKSM